MSFFVHVDWDTIRSSAEWYVDTVFAFPRLTAPWSRELDFAALAVYKPNEDWFSNEASLVPLRKPELKEFLQTWSSIHRQQHAESARTNRREGFLMNFGQSLLLKFLPLATALRNQCKGFTLTRREPVSVALVDPTKM